MTRLTAILLAGLLIGQSFSFAISEVSKLDDLIEHAIMHSREYGDSFLTFFSKHYGEQQREHSGDHSEHDELPFHHQSGVHLLVMFMGNSAHSLANYNGFDSGDINHAFYRESIPNFVVSRIFQPPIQA